MRFKFRIKNPQLFLILSVLVVGLVVALFANKDSNEQESVHHTNTKFIELTTNRNVACFGANRIYSMSDSERLQGSCCSPMSLHRYEEQVEGLKNYASISQIPPDPYDISVEQAKQLLNYKNTIKLSYDQDKTYKDAMKMSDEGGPCCCKCWRWDVYEGLAEYLIVIENFTAEQVAEVWDLSDGCGGEGHATGVHA